MIMIRERPTGSSELVAIFPNAFPTTHTLHSRSVHQFPTQSQCSQKVRCWVWRHSSDFIACLRQGLISGTAMIQRSKPQAPDLHGQSFLLVAAGSPFGLCTYQFSSSTRYFLECPEPCSLYLYFSVSGFWQLDCTRWTCSGGWMKSKDLPTACFTLTEKLQVGSG